MEAKHNGIVIRKVNYGDNDVIITILTGNGCLSASAKGCRKNNAKLKNAAELFSMGEFVLAKGTTGKYTLTGWTPTEMFYEMRNDYEKLAAAVYMANIIEYIAKIDTDTSEYLLLLVFCMKLLVYSEKTVKEVLLIFLLRIAAAAGYRPVLDSCVKCGRADVRHFGVDAGGTLCSACAEREDTVVSGETLNVFAFISDASMREVERCDFSGSANSANVTMMTDYVTDKLGTSPKSLKALKLFL